MEIAVDPIEVDQVQLFERLPVAGLGALDASDGKYLVPLRRVVYVKRFARESRVGFGSG